MKRKIGLFREENFIINKNLLVIFNGIFGFKTEEEVESSVCFANYLSSVGINRNNYYLFLKILETNNKWIIDALFGKREPRLLFSIIRPNKFLIKRAFRMLTLFHPDEIYSTLLQALLGIIENSYHNADDGYKIYKFSITDLNNIGKYLNKDKDQLTPENSLLLDILDHFTKLGLYQNIQRKSLLSKHAFNIRFAYFDNTKKMTDIIPHVLLVRLKREDNEVNPSKPFINFLKSKKNLT